MGSVPDQPDLTLALCYLLIGGDVQLVLQVEVHRTHDVSDERHSLFPQFPLAETSAIVGSLPANLLRLGH